MWKSSPASNAPRRSTNSPRVVEVKTTSHAEWQQRTKAVEASGGPSRPGRRRSRHPGPAGTPPNPTPESREGKPTRTDRTTGLSLGRSDSRFGRASASARARPQGESEKEPGPPIARGGRGSGGSPREAGSVSATIGVSSGPRFLYQPRHRPPGALGPVGTVASGYAVGFCAGLAPTPRPSPLTAHDTAANRWIDRDEGRAPTG